MKPLLIFFFIILSTQLASAQHSFSIWKAPLFTTPQDSAEYYSLQKHLFNAYRQAQNKTADSISRLMKEASVKIRGYQTIYQASPLFTPFDSVRYFTDPQAIKKLSISNTSLKKIPRQLFQCNNLQHLELVNTRLRKISRLKMLPHLQSIYVLNNQSKRPLRLSKSKSVITFGMRGSDPSALPRTFSRLSNLQKLDLSQSNLQQFPGGYQRNKRLKEIYLSGNQLVLENDVIAPSKSVERLELSGNSIKAVPSGVQRFPNLKILNLNYNNIENIHPAIANLKKLEYLRLYRNRLKHLPIEIYSLRQLKELELYYNEIDRIDEAIGQLDNLEILYLSYNKILHLPETITSLSQLQAIYLSGNRLSDLPQNLFKLKLLKVLRINQNNLSLFPANIGEFTNLEFLDISNNYLTVLPVEIAELPRLEILSVYNNPWDPVQMTDIQGLIDLLRLRGIAVHVDETLAKVDEEN